MNWGASYWSNDIYQRLICQHWLKREPKSSELVVVARLSNILIVAIALIITANLGSIQAAWRISLLFGAGMGSVLVMRWLWERINLYSELAAMVTSLVVAPLLLLFTKAEWIRLAVMAAVSTTAAIMVTFFTPTSEEVLKRFYTKVRPLGFWKKTALLIDQNPHIPLEGLQKEIVTILLTSLSLFFMLIGTAKLILPMPGQSFLIPIGLIIIAALLIPIWWPRAIPRH